MRPSCVHFKQHVKLAVVGGGAGGTAVAAKFARTLGAGKIALIEPQKEHYYQPGFTLVGGGLMRMDQLIRPEASLIPRGVDWMKTGVAKFDCEKNTLELSNGNEIEYDFLVVATGVQLRFDLVKGLPEALESPASVSSIYDPRFVEKTFREIQKFKGGRALFTFPNTPIKCAGAPQKICYIAEDYWRKHGIRDKADVSYHTSLGKVFGVEKYANALMKVVESRNIAVETKRNLIEVNPEQKTAKFEFLDANSASTGETTEEQFDFLHVGAPCSPVPTLRQAADSKNPLVDGKGFVAVDADTLRSTAFPNVFAIGDCANTPNAKTAAAISSQFRALKTNLQAAMNNQPLTAQYDGYASCPLVVSSNRVILAEFTPSGPLETLPVNQAQPLWISYLMKRYLMPSLYWHFLVKGYWNGPKTIRKLLHLGFSK